MADRKKLELQLNQPVALELLFDQPQIGNSQYGEYIFMRSEMATGIQSTAFLLLQKS